MGYTFSVNNIPATGAEGVFIIKATMVAAGWTVLSSSDGSTYNSSGDNIFTGSSGGMGYGNSNAWFRIQAPSVSGQTREFIYQHDSNAGTNTTVRIKYSPIAGFTGGSPSATEVPSATDEVIIIGGGTDASPSFSTLFGANDGLYRLHVAMGGATERYSFYWTSLGFANENPLAGFSMDVMQAGSYSTLDLDPAVIYTDNGGSQIWGNNIRANPQSFMGSINSANFVTTPLCSYSNFPSGIGSNAWSNKDDAIPTFYARTSTSLFGVKGWSTLFLYNSVNRGNTSTMSVSSLNDRVYINGLLLPWNGGSFSV